MYIAHINPVTKEIQTVKEHCTGVSDLCRSFGSKIGLAETAYLTGLLHDMAKVTKVFQQYICDSTANPTDKSLKGSINHSSGGAKYIFDKFNSGDKFQRLTSQLLALVIFSHHSGLSDIICTDGTDVFARRLNPDREIYFDETVAKFLNECVEAQEIEDIFQKSRDELIALLNRIKDENIFNAFTLHLVVKFVFSCLIDGDRLDTINFMEGKKVANDFPNIHKIWKELYANLEIAIDEFVDDSEINILRKEISDTCKAFGSNKPGIYRLYVPTGGGKTLSSLRYAISHANIKEFNKERIYYIIPFTTIIDQNAQVIADVLITEKLRDEDIILEHHSNVIEDNIDENYKLLTDRWNSPIVLTTMVQFLNTIFSDGTQNIRRFHNLANSVIILDEIQSIPVNCINLLNGALNFLSKLCNATIVLCTATQPPLSETSKPLLLSSQMDIVKDIEEKFLKFKRVELIDSCIDGGYDIQNLSEFIMEKMNLVDNCLIILNTKTIAKKLYTLVKEINSLLPQKEKFNLFHLSTSMCPAHRTTVINEIKVKLGKERVICISTQLIEAGVDISFQCVVRALAGFDSIAQAAGRCNRNGESGRFRRVYIVNIKNEDLSRLPEIRIGQECSERVLKEFVSYPDIYDGELLSPKVIDAYYSFYYQKLSNKMDYNIKEENTELFELLSNNSKGVTEYYDRVHKQPPYPLRQAFETAGKNFLVIDNNTSGVLVPYYNEGKEIIEKLNGSCDLRELKNLIKKAQHFTVNLYSYEIDKIGNGIYQLNNGGILALIEEYYDPNLGVLTEGRPKDFLSI